jgi:hypothetical protein
VAAKGGRFTYQVEGAKELRRTLRKAGDDMKDLKVAHADAARIVSDAAVPKAPRRTGALAGTIRPAGTKTMAIVRAGYARVPYAGVQEWGWPRRNIPAQPYIVPAAHETEADWVKRYDEEIERILGKVEGA